MDAFQENKPLEPYVHRWHDATHIMNAPPPRSRLLPFLMGAYVLLIVNASLYPFSGWQPPAEGPWAFLTGGWPRYLHAWEIPLNVAAYVPLGFVLVLHFAPRLRWPWAVLFATMTGLGLSFCLESVQSFLPARITSNLDLASNALGALLGAAAGCAMDKSWSLRARLHAFRSRRVSRGVVADFALTLTLVWLFVQLNPEIGFLGTADLGTLLGHEEALPYSARAYFALEALLSAMNLVSIGAFLSVLTLSRRSWTGGIAIVLACAAMLKAMAGQALLRDAQPLLWLTPGLFTGAVLGAIVLASWYWRGASMKLLGLGALLGGSALSWLVPANPYLAVIVQPIAHGHISSVNGATWWVAQLWPWMAFLCLLKLPYTRYGNAR